MILQRVTTTIDNSCLPRSSHVPSGVGVTKRLVKSANVSSTTPRRGEWRIMFIIKKIIFTMIGAFVLVGLAGFQPASASTVSVDDGQWSSSGSKFSASSAMELSGSSKIQLEYHGKVTLTKREKTAKGCPLVSSFKSGQKKGTKCFRLKRGAKFTNSGRTRGGGNYWYDDYVGSPGSKSPDAKWMKFVVRGGHWVKAGDQHGHGNCKNPSKPYKKGGPTYKSVLLYKSFSNVKWTVKGSLSESGELSAWAEAVCTNSGSSARVKAKGSYAMAVSVTVWAKTKAQAKLKGAGSISVSQRNNVSIKARANAKMKIEAEASAWCKDTPTTPPPPVDNPPSIEAKGSPAHLYVNGNAAVFFEAWDPDGDSISVKVSATGGTVAGLVEVGTRWNGTPCPTGRTCYRATAWAGSNPGTMTITATVTAKGKNDTVTVSFPVVADEF